MLKDARFPLCFAAVACICLVIGPPALAQTDSGVFPSEAPLEWPSFDAQSTSGPAPPKGLDRGLSSEALDYEVVISGVPAYIWLNGCGPTSAGMVLGYWDGRGFDGLVPGSAATQTQAVDDMISTSGNYDDYCLPMDTWPNIAPDRSEPPFGDEHPDDCIADFMKTSQSYHDNSYGYSWLAPFDNAMEDYARMVAPDYRVDAETFLWGRFTWDMLRTEIDAARPVILLVDLDGDVIPDHFVPAIGYGESGGTRMYACLDTWDHNIHWYEFARINPGRTWGILSGTTCSLTRAELGRINLRLPGNESILSSPPTFAWTPDGGANNAFAVDLSYDWTFSWYWSTFENMRQLVSGASWTMPADTWSMIPSGSYVYWRVRGADFDATPLTIFSSDEVRWFYKQ